tara:strand:- start:11 stop:145 length:135 start_codon:yes stop_codon:yes gene_type:complete
LQGLKDICGVADMLRCGQEPLFDDGGQLPPLDDGGHAPPLNEGA